MKNINQIKWLTMMICLVLIFTFSVQNTFGYIVTSTPSLINTFKPIQKTINGFTINKTVEHPFGDSYTVPDSLLFDFDIDLGANYAGYTLKTSDGDKTLDENGKICVSVKPGISLSVNGIEAGTNVKITEKQNHRGFTAKDSPSQEITILEDEALTIEYTNIYSPDSITPSVTVKGTKILEGREWQEDDTFSFLLEYDGGNGQWRELSTQTIKYDRNDSNFNMFDFTQDISKLEFDNIGIYSFRISEIKGSLGDVAYDETVNNFRITVTDTDMDGKLEIGKIEGKQNITVNGSDVSVIFNNTFIPSVTPETPEDITVGICVNKVVNNTGSAILSPEGFSFELTDRETKNKYISTSGADGKAVVELPFTYSDIGKSFTYNLSEINDGKQYVTYSSDVHTIVITVAYDEFNNELITNITVNGNKMTDVDITFTNVYDHDPTPPTSDSFNFIFWCTIMTLSGTAILALILRRKHWNV